MAITNGYATLAELKTSMQIADATDDTELEDAIEAASRQIDAHCGRRFWQDATVVARTYQPMTSTLVEVDDISTTVGLVVKIDTGDDGTYATTITESTDFVLAPLNAAAETPVRPYEEIVLVDNYTFPTSQRRPSVQVTAKFGWPAVPPDVTRACIIQAKNLFKASRGVFSSFQLAAEAGIAVQVPGFDRTSLALLNGFVKQVC